MASPRGFDPCCRREGVSVSLTLAQRGATANVKPDPTTAENADFKNSHIAGVLESA